MADQAQRSRSVYIGNLPFEIKDDGLKKLFSQVGTIVSLRMPVDPENNKSRGFAFCEFRDQESVAVAIKHFHGYELDGRKIRVDSAANNSDKDAKSSGPFFSESVYGETCDPVKAPEIIAQVIGHMSPQQVTAIISEAKRCLQGDPQEARVALVNNPQMTYALLLALVRGRYITKERGTEALAKPEPPLLPLFPEARPPLLATAPPIHVQQPQPLPIMSMAQPIHTIGTVGGQVSQMYGPPPTLPNPQSRGGPAPPRQFNEPLIPQPPRQQPQYNDLSPLASIPTTTFRDRPVERLPPPRKFNEPHDRPPARKFNEPQDRSRNFPNESSQDRAPGRNFNNSDSQDRMPGRNYNNDVQDRVLGRNFNNEPQERLPARHFNSDQQERMPGRSFNNNDPQDHTSARNFNETRTAPYSRPFNETNSRGRGGDGPRMGERRGMDPSGHFEVNDRSPITRSPHMPASPPVTSATSREEQEKAELIMQVLNLKEEDIAKMAPEQQNTVRKWRDQFKS